MGYLAFHRDRIDSLRMQLIRSLDEVTGLRLDDPAAIEEKRRLGRIDSTMRYWLAPLQGISACVAMEGYEPVGRLDPNDLTTAPAQRLDTDGYRLVHDPLGGGIGDPYLEAQAIALTLGDGNLDKLLSEAELNWLNDRLTEILASPVGRWGFIDTLGADGLTQLCRKLGQEAAQEQSPYATDRERLGAILTTLGLLGAGLADRHHDGGSTSQDEVLAAIDPMAAAYMLAAMDLPSDDLARLAHDVISRAGVVTAPGGRIPNRIHPGDILFPHIAADPLASVAYVQLSIGNLDALFKASVARDAVGQIILHATDPDLVKAAGLRPGSLIPSMFEYLGTGKPLDGWADSDVAWLGDVVIRYPFNFTGDYNHWDWTDAQASTALALAASHDAALERMRAGAGAMFDVVGAESDIARLTTLLHDIAGFQIDLLDAIRDGVIGDAKAAQKGWDLAWLVAGLAIGVVAGALLPELEVGAIAGLVVEGSVGAGAGAATTAVQTWWREHHLPGTPPDIAAAARGASETMDDTITAQTGLLMRLTLELAKSKGLVDPQKLDPLPVPMPLDPQHSGNCSGKKYAEQVYDWLAQGRSNGAFKDGGYALLATAASLQSESAAHLLCHDIVLG